MAVPSKFTCVYSNGPADGNMRTTVPFVLYSTSASISQTSPWHPQFSNIQTVWTVWVLSTGSIFGLKRSWFRYVGELGENKNVVMARESFWATLDSKYSVEFHFKSKYEQLCRTLELIHSDVWSLLQVFNFFAQNLIIYYWDIVNASQ